MAFKVVFLANLASTLLLTGLIWFVQVVHYPLFGVVPAAGFAPYALAHQERTSVVVVLPMVVELLTAVALAVHPPQWIDAWQTWLALATVGGIWLATFFLAVPRHKKLSSGFDADAHRTLVATNWVRTLLWSVRALMVLLWTWKFLS